MEDWKLHLRSLEFEGYYVPSQEIIKARYKNLAMKYHPDKTEGFAEKMIAINAARSFFKDHHEEAIEAFCTFIHGSIEKELPFLSTNIETIRANQELLGEVMDIFSMDNN